MQNAITGCFSMEKPVNNGLPFDRHRFSWMAWEGIGWEASLNTTVPETSGEDRGGKDAPTWN